VGVGVAAGRVLVVGIEFGLGAGLAVAEQAATTRLINTLAMGEYTERIGGTPIDSSTG